MPEELEAQIAEATKCRWLRVQGASGIVYTFRGSRPGDVFSDVLFNFIVAKVDTTIYNQRCKNGPMTTVQWRAVRTPDRMDPGDKDHKIELPTIPFVDDLAVPVRSAAPEHLGQAQTAAVVVDALAAHGLLCNFARGKSEAIMVYAGRGARDAAAFV